MPHSDAHEYPIANISEQFMVAKLAQEKVNPELKLKWALHHNKSSPLVDLDRDDATYEPDMSITRLGRALFLMEAAYKQSWTNLVTKVDRMLESRASWGVLVVKISERGRWSPPSRRPVTDDFVSEEEWYERAASLQAASFGAFSIDGWAWTKPVTVDVCYFPRTWRRGQQVPTLVCILN
jgi:hypothetical protein